MPHYKNHKLASSDHSDVYAPTPNTGDVLVFRKDPAAGVGTEGASTHLIATDPNLTDLNLDSLDPPIHSGLWLSQPQTATGGSGGAAGIDGLDANPVPPTTGRAWSLAVGG